MPFQSILRFSKHLSAASLIAGLTVGCVSSTGTGAIGTDGVPPLAAINLPAMHRFSSPPPQGATRSNRSLAQDFLDLSFQLENGAALPVMTRFEGPISLRTTGRHNPVAQQDLTQLLRRIQNEAGLTITQVPAEQAANITIEFVPYSVIRRIVPSAVCVVVPGVDSWQDYRSQRRSEHTSWADLPQRETLAIFVPETSAPQDIRDCLHEELAQALGPVNDLWRLQDSVFNDDNFHVVLTRFDMLMLRLTYDRALHSGMSRAEVASRLPQILERINPEGSYNAGRTTAAISPAPWRDAIEMALYSTASVSKRRISAENAITIARRDALPSQLLALGYYVQGRLDAGRDVRTSANALLEAGKIYQRTPGAELQAAHVSHRLAFEALKSGNTVDAIRLIDGALPIIEKAQNAIVLSSLLMLKAQAFELEGRQSEAELIRREGLGWALYGIGDIAKINQRLSEIASLAPAHTQNGEI